MAKSVSDVETLSGVRPRSVRGAGNTEVTLTSRFSVLLRRERSMCVGWRNYGKLPKNKNMKETNQKMGNRYKQAGLQKMKPKIPLEK